MLIRSADLAFGMNGERKICDIRITGDRISEIASTLKALPGETVIAAAGQALLPGLHDHHIHLVALAAALDSVRCGPPDVSNAGQLAAALGAADRDARAGWLRGIGYHETVAGEIDRDWLDRHIHTRPVRIQHRSGRLWILNSRALATLGIAEAGAASDPFERVDGRLSGRLYDADGWLRHRLGSQRPGLHRVSRLLASHGITGVTDTSHHNGLGDYAYFVDAQRREELLQEIVVMGDATLDAAASGGRVHRGPTKFHLHDNALPDFDTLCTAIRHSHQAQRPVAFHCVSRTDLTFALAALDGTGSRPGDRIEHASIVPPDAVASMKKLGVIVVTQPGFIAERGDAYRDAVEVEDLPWLYRLRSLQQAGIPLAGSSDAPYGDANPWRAMDAAVMRHTASGHAVGLQEALTTEEALQLFTSPLLAPGRRRGPLCVGEIADCCLLNTSWAEAKLQLSTVGVRLTLAGGRIIWQS